MLRVIRAVSAFCLSAVCLRLALSRSLLQTIEGRWKLLAAEDIRADGSVARYPWGRSPVGSIVVERGCLLHPDHVERHAVVRRRRRADRRAHEGGAALHLHRVFGACTIDEREGSVVLKVEAAWRPDYVGTEQKRFFRFDSGRLISVRRPERPLQQRVIDAPVDARASAVEAEKRHESTKTTKQSFESGFVSIVFSWLPFISVRGLSLSAVRWVR